MFARLAASRLLRTRALSSSVPRSAAQPSLPPGIDPAAYEALKGTAVFQKLSKSPEAFAAVVKFAEIMQAQGLASPLHALDRASPTTLQVSIPHRGSRLPCFKSPSSS